MLRRDVEALVARLSGIAGVEDLALTTNAHFLGARARGLREAGLRRVTISLDSLDPERFALLTGRNELPVVLGGLDAALEAGLSPVKVNCVVIRGVNDDQVGEVCRLRAREGHPGALHRIHAARQRQGLAA